MLKTYGDCRLPGFDPYPNYTNEMTMTAGLLALYGLINLVPGVFDLVRFTTDGQDWSGDSDVYPPVVLLLAALIQVLFSFVSMAVGFQYLVSGASHKLATMFSTMLSLLSLFTLVVMVSYISFLADKDDFNFIPSAYNPSSTENESVATLGVLGYIAYAATNFGALIHLNYKMWKFQSEKWTSFNRGHYKFLLMVFGFFTLLAGIVQLALGAYVYDKVEEELLDSSVYAGPYNVAYSEISMTFGCAQVLLGFFIMFRAFQSPIDGNNGKSMFAFQAMAWFVLALSIALQVLTQSSMEQNVDKSAAGGFAAQVTCMVVGLALFPVYLDAMYYTMPTTIEHGWFSATAPLKKGAEEEEERKVESAPPAAEV